MLLRGARQLVTLAGPAGYRRGAALRDLNIITDGAMLIRDGIIEHVGPSRRLDNLAEARTAVEIDATGRVVLPVFVDCFTHLLSGPPRWELGTESERAASIRTLHSWSAQRLDLEGRKRLRQFLRFGTGLAGAGCGYGCDEESDLRALRSVDRLASPVLDLAPVLHTDSSAFAALGLDHAAGFGILERLATVMLPFAASKRLVRGVAVDSGFPREAVEGYLACAKRLGLLAFLDSPGGCAPMPADAIAGLASATDDDIRYLADASATTAAILLPGRSFHSATAYAPARRLIDSGAAVALATGFDPLHCATPSMPMVLSLATTQLRMSAEEAISAATVNAAHALGLGSRAGRLECGRRADFLIADCADYREIPLYFGTNPVASVVRAGERVFPRLEG